MAFTGTRLTRVARMCASAAARATAQPASFGLRPVVRRRRTAHRVLYWSIHVRFDRGYAAAALLNSNQPSSVLRRGNL